MIVNPVLVNLWRGNAIESRHRGSVAVVQSDGQLILSMGDVLNHTFPRSAIKFLQTIPLIESGAVEHFGLTEEHIALACASHNGEDVHVGLVSQWLDLIGLNANDLECGATLPMHEATKFELLACGEGPTRVHHGCSGKHLGMLSTCLHLGDTIKDYRHYRHSAQRRWFEVVESMSSSQVMQLPWGYDGCGVPCLALPLQRVALAMARFADATDQDATRTAAIARIQSAVSKHPYLVAGKERLCTDLMARLAPNILIKVGAEGCYTACIPEQGIGIALKMEDGQGRGARIALGAVLRKLGVLDDHMVKELGEYFAPILTNSRGDVIGRAEASSDWQNVSVKAQVPFAFN